MAGDRAEERSAEPNSSRLSSVADFARALREKYFARCQALEEEHLDQAIEQEAREIPVDRIRDRKPDSPI